MWNFRSIVDWTQQIKESINLKIGNSTHLNWNTDGKKNLSDFVGQFKSSKVSAIWVSKQEEWYSEGQIYSLKQCC